MTDDELNEWGLAFVEDTLDPEVYDSATVEDAMVFITEEHSDLSLEQLRWLQTFLEESR
jgi:hypothetical protein